MTKRKRNDKTLMVNMATETEAIPVDPEETEAIPVDPDPGGPPCGGRP